MAAIATLGVAGCVSTDNIAGVSGTCTQPTTLNDGFFANRSIFFRLATQTDPTDPQTQWLCYRVKVTGQPEQAGRVDVKATTEAPGARVTNDTASRSCATMLGNLITTHPIEQGEVLETPFYIDAGSNLGTTALCVEAGAVKQRVAVELTGALNDPDVIVNSDTAPPAPTDTTPPPPGKASSACAEGAFGPASELINAHLSGRDLFLYTATPANDEAHVCARLSGPGASGGVRLSVKAAVNQIVDIQQSGDISPCTNDVVVLSSPALAIRTSPAGQLPASVCVNNTRFTILAGPIPPVVTFQFDS
ncbi:MAG TPA: hypothetical protein VF545_03135 [Thermoleophilaceae bacterium]|jgi:hypothetical protein